MYIFKTPTTPWICDVCGQMFGSSKEYKRHIMLWSLDTDIYDEITLKNEYPEWHASLLRSTKEFMEAQSKEAIMKHGADKSSTYIRQFHNANNNISFRDHFLDRKSVV